MLVFIVILFRWDTPLNKKMTFKISSSGGIYKRIYFHHIRKTAGTSINYSFFQLTGEDPLRVHDIIRSSPEKTFRMGNLVYQGSNRDLLHTGDFSYGFSHIPFHQLHLPMKTFTFTVLRDPAARLISHYKMILDYQRTHVRRDWLATEIAWIGSSFSDFLRNIPKERLLNQLFMFSSTFNPEEAANNIRCCSYYFFLKNFKQGLSDLSTILGLNLACIHTRRGTCDPMISPRELKDLYELLRPEYDMIQLLENA
jgi:hypothetical protein